MQDKLNELREIFIDNLEKITNGEWLEKLEKDFLWKKWKLNDILKGIKDLGLDSLCIKVLYNIMKVKLLLLNNCKIATIRYK